MSEKKMNPHAGHRERMRERFHKNGLEGFSDHEILEFLLFYVYAQKNTNDLGHLLLQRFGTLSAVFDAEYEELIQVNGIGERAAMLIKLMPEIARKYYGNDRISVSLKKSEARCSYFLKELGTRSEEVILLGCLTDHWRLHSLYTLATGSPDQVQIDPQKLMRLALASGCTTFVLAHNHPKGIAVASYEDIRVTESIRRLLENVRMHLVDHIIVADGKSISMLECGCTFSGA
ncbi:MAG: DNA repair protein RadC [Oscillospiraceae bacterium]|nr:DNA repair protein RadC [Oscillospiraceae bacterium]